MLIENHMKKVSKLPLRMKKKLLILQLSRLTFLGAANLDLQHLVMPKLQIEKQLSTRYLQHNWPTKPPIQF